MALLKQQVFLVSGRFLDEENEPRGPVGNIVVCSVDFKSVGLLLEQQEPRLHVLSITSLVMLEETAKKIKAVISGKDDCWKVVIAPELLSSVLG